MTANLRLMKKLGERTCIADSTRRRRRRLRLRWLGHRAPAHREGLPRRGRRGRRALRGRGLRDDLVRRTRFLFRPELGCYGIQRIDAVRDSLILAGAGVGGGSLVYANTLYEPLDAFYRDPQWRDIADWKTELAPYYDQAKRMLGVVENPLRTPSDEVMEKVAGDMGVGDTFHPTPVGVFFGGPGRAAGRAGRRPVLRWRRARPAHLHRLRRLHDRLQVQREEHPGEELPLPRRAARGPGAAADDGHARAPARRWWVRRHVEVHQGQSRHPSHDADDHRRPGRLRGRGHRHPEAAAPDEGRGAPAGALGPARPPLAHQLRVDPGRDRPRPLDRLQLRHRDHLLLPPRRPHPRRAGALRQGQQRDGAAPDRAHRRRRPRAALAHLAEGDVEGASQCRRALRPQALVGAHRRRPGDADASTTRSPSSPSGCPGRRSGG